MPQRLSLAELTLCLADAVYDEVPDVTEALELESES